MKNTELIIGLGKLARDRRRCQKIGRVICTEDGKRKVASMNAAACGKYARGAV